MNDKLLNLGRTWVVLGSYLDRTWILYSPNLGRSWGIVGSLECHSDHTFVHRPHRAWQSLCLTRVNYPMYTGAPTLKKRSLEQHVGNDGIIWK